MGLDVLHDHVPQGPIVERVGPFLRNALQRLGVVAANQLLAWVRWGIVREETRPAGREVCQVLLTVADNLDQIWTDGKPLGLS